MTQRLSQLVVEVELFGGTSDAQVSQSVVEVSTPFVGTAVPPGAQVSQSVLEVSVKPALLPNERSLGQDSQPAFAGSLRSQVGHAGSLGSQVSA